MKKLQKVTVLFNQADDVNLLADSDTEKSAKDIANTLSQKYSVDLLGIDSSNVENILKIKSDAIFNMVEWTVNHMDDLKNVFQYLHKTGIPFTGSDYDGYVLSCDKAIMKKAMLAKNIPTPKYMIMDNGNEQISDLEYPLIVKPTTQHSGIGVTQDSFVKNEAQLRAQAKKLITKYKEPVVVEEFIEGRELHVTILEKNGKPWVLPIAEVEFDQSDGYASVLTYDGKWNEESVEYSKSYMKIAELDAKTLKLVEEVAKRAYQNLGGLDYPRLDIRLRGNEIFVLEINNNPGIDFDDESGFGLSGKTAGFSYLEILTHILENSCARFAQNKYDTIAS